MQHPGWVLVIVGVFIAIIRLGRLPGDIAIERPNFRLYFSLATCIHISLPLTGVIWLVRYFSQ